MAKGYSEAEGGKFRPSTKIHISVPGAAGALIGSPPDLAAWADALASRKGAAAARFILR